MRRILLACMACLIVVAVPAQDLLRSRTSSYYTLVYKLTNREAEHLTTATDAALQKKYLHTLVDSYATDSVYRKPLSTGHYLHIRTNNNRVKGTLESVNNVDITVLDNHRDLLLLFHDSLGNEIKSLRPSLGIRHIPFSDDLQAYRIPTTNRQGWISVTHKGHTSFFNIHRRYNNTLPARAKRRVLGTFPINHLVSPIFYVGNTVKSLFSYPRVSTPGIYYRVKRIFEPRSFDGFMVLNKPEFKPGDTVRMKAFAVKRKNGKPINHIVTATLGGYVHGNYVSHSLARLKPYRPGGYVHEFVLADSLELSLDTRYEVSITDRKENEFPAASFQFGQYELKQNFFSVRRLPGSDHAPATLLLKGVDSNDMGLFDASARVVVTSKMVDDFAPPIVFVADTLWDHTLKLEALGETAVALPDSIFPAVSLAYGVSVVFADAARERQVKNISLTYEHREPPTKMMLRNDSLVVRSTLSSLRLRYVNRHGVAFREKGIDAPFSERIDAMVNRYALYNDTTLVAGLTVEKEADSLLVLAERTMDSLLLDVQNPRALLFRYQLFRNNRIIDQGNARAYTARKKTSPADMYYLALQYLWAGESKEQNYDLPFSRKTLDIQLDHPSTVFPGHAATVTIHVNDALGKPVKDVDLTTYAITRKFAQAKPPVVPVFERFDNRRIFNDFNLQHHDNIETSNLLHRDFWKSQLGLDSIVFYQFLYPHHGRAEFYARITDSLTQIAPFVVHNGQPLPVYYVRIDQHLVYSSESGESTPYSFRVRPGRCTVTLRLRQHHVTIHDVVVRKGMKLVLSVALNDTARGVTVTNEKARYTTSETNNLWPHFLAIDYHSSNSDFIHQGENFYAVPSQRWRYSLVGPLFVGPMAYHAMNDSLFFQYRPGRLLYPSERMTESIRSQLQRRFTGKLPYLSGSQSVYDEVLTEESLRNRWTKPVENPVFEKKYATGSRGPKGSATLAITKMPTPAAPIFAAFLINLEAPDDYYVFAGDKLSYAALANGLYQVVLIYADGRYLKPAPVPVRPYGRTLLNLEAETVLPADTFSREVQTRIWEWWQTPGTDHQQQRDMQDLRGLYYHSNPPPPGFSAHSVRGKVMDNDGPVPGASVIIKGTAWGTVTDMDGAYQIHVPAGGVLVFSFVGYQSVEQATEGKETMDITMQADVQQLSEVVVVGYGTSGPSVIAPSLQGRLAGVSVSRTSSLPSASSIRLRGLSSVNSQPLVIIDGVVKSVAAIVESDVKSMEVLHADEAIALYGERARHGAILISTKGVVTRAQLLLVLPGDSWLSQAGESSPGTSLRKNFCDDAFWQPQLRTDRRGRASFTATFPDDIAGWNVHVLAMASRGRTGAANSRMQSFKPLAAQVLVPNFLLAGDSAVALGKITHYGTDTILLQRTIAMSGKTGRTNHLAVRHTHLDSISLVSTGDDSVTVQYEVMYNHYTDGERRTLPVLPAGTREHSGFFAALPRDTVITFPFDTRNGKVTLYAQADLLDVMLDEIDVVKAYPYDCNEQLASKLKAFLAEKMICDLRGKKFPHDAQVHKLIRRLVENQYADGSWSWWGMRGKNHWITLHVMEALRSARRQGYKAAYDDQHLRLFLMEHTVPSLPVDQQVRSWIQLVAMGEVISARTIVDSLTPKLRTLHEKLLVQRLLQLHGQPVDWRLIETQKHITLKGNWYWGEQGNALRGSAIEISLLVFQLMEHRDPQDPNLDRIQNYFLEKRDRQWNNTYHSSRIVETLLPRLLKQSTGARSPAIVVNNGRRLEKFPLDTVFTNQEQITLRKTGAAPVYVTAFQQHWNPAPAAVAKDFVVTSAWEGNVAALTAGRPTKLRVTVHVRHDAEYVMINIPIPAGCTYNTREQGYRQGEVHREHDLHEARIYCERLAEGKYEYEVDLLPRFSGRYLLNPAKAECMYFPVLFGREGMKRVAID